MGRQTDPQPDKGKDAAAPGHNKDADGKPAKKVEAPPQPPSNDTIAADAHTADLAKAAKAPHEHGQGVLKKGQKLRDGTVVNTDLPVTYAQTPEGKIVVGGIYDGKRL